MPDPISANIQPAGAAFIGALVVAVMLLLLYVYRLKSFILLWVFGWLMMGISMYLTSGAYTNPAAGRLAMGIFHLFGLGACICFTQAAYLLLGESLLKLKHVPFVFPAVAWFLLAYHEPLTRYVNVSGYVIGAVFLGHCGYMYLKVLRQRKLLGAGVVGVGFLVVAINIMVGMAGRAIEATGLEVVIFVFNSLLFSFAILGMHLLVFEEMTYEVRRTNQELAAAQEELLKMATVDGVTGCQNRGFFEQLIPRELQRHRRYGTPLSVLFIDIDRFKSINDRFGHSIGDEVLRYVGNFLKQNVREADYVVRWGGDEFVVMLSCSEQAAQDKAAALQAEFTSLATEPTLPAPVRLSIGIAEVPAMRRTSSPQSTPPTRRCTKSKPAPAIRNGGQRAIFEARSGHCHCCLAVFALSSGSWKRTILRKRDFSPRSPLGKCAHCSLDVER